MEELVYNYIETLQRIKEQQKEQNCNSNYKYVRISNIPLYGSINYNNAETIDYYNKIDEITIIHTWKFLVYNKHKYLDEIYSENQLIRFENLLWRRFQVKSKSKKFNKNFGIKRLKSLDFGINHSIKLLGPILLIS
jgi:hypothetical protein